MPEVSINNLVARLARHTVQLAQLGDAQYLAQVICDKLGLLVHRRGLTPRHGHLLRCPLVCSTCYPCPPTKLLPMCPDRTQKRRQTWVTEFDVRGSVLLDGSGTPLNPPAFGHPPCQGGDVKTNPRSPLFTSAPCEWRRRAGWF